MQALTVASQRHPFTPPTRHERMPIGMNILEIATSCKMPDRFFLDGVVTVGDQVVPRELWGYVRPKAGTDVAVQMIPHGSDVFRTVAMIAILAGSVLISGGALSGLGAALFPGAGIFAAGSTSALLAAGTFSIGETCSMDIIA